MGLDRGGEEMGWGRAAVEYCEVGGSLLMGRGGEVRGQRQPAAAVGFELVGFDIDSGRGVDGAPR